MIVSFFEAPKALDISFKNKNDVLFIYGDSKESLYEMSFAELSKLNKISVDELTIKLPMSLTVYQTFSWKSIEQEDGTLSFTFNRFKISLNTKLKQLVSNFDIFGSYWVLGKKFYVQILNKYNTKKFKYEFESEKEARDFIIKDYLQTDQHSYS